MEQEQPFASTVPQTPRNAHRSQLTTPVRAERDQSIASTVSPSRTPRIVGRSQPTMSFRVEQEWPEEPQPSRTPRIAGRSQPTMPFRVEQEWPEEPQPWPAPIHQTMGPVRHAEEAQVYRRICTISGSFVRNEYEISPMSISSLLGSAVDEYLWAQGFEQGSVDIIRSTYERSPNRRGFIKHLSGAGMVAAEAEYLHKIITRAL